jgi:hypothetical protein
VLEKQKRDLKQKIDDEALEQQEQREKVERNYNNRLETIRDQILHLKSDIEGTHFSNIEKNKKELTEENARLKLLIEQEKKDKMIEINERERSKIYAIKKLSEEMDYKVRETQANLMALNDEQLQTTTRLTILQNH